MSIKADIQNTWHFHGHQQQTITIQSSKHASSTMYYTHTQNSWTQLLWQQFIEHLVDSNRYSVVPINSSLLTIMLSVMKTIVCNDTKYSVPLQDNITEFDCVCVCVWASNIHQSHLNLNFTTTTQWWPWEGTPTGRLIFKRLQNFINIYIYI